MKILVTGSAGFIGSNLTNKLISLGHKVVGIDNFSNGNEDFVNLKSIIERVDIRDTDGVKEVFLKHSPEVVFHLAAQIDLRKSIEDPKSDYEINVLGSKNIIEASKNHRVKKIIFSSSAAVYGDNSNLPIKETEPLSPQSQYGNSKSEVENLLKILSNTSGIRSVVLRYSNVYGPRQGSKGEGGVVAVFCKRINSNKPLVVFGSGEQTRDFIYVDDVVMANIKAMESSAEFAVYNVSTSFQISINDLSLKLLKISGKDCKIEHQDFIKGEILKSSLDNYLIKKRLGWSANESLQSGLKKTLEWFRGQ